MSGQLGTSSLGNSGRRPWNPRGAGIAATKNPQAEHRSGSVRNWEGLPGPGPADSCPGSEEHAYEQALAPGGLRRPGAALGVSEGEGTHRTHRGGLLAYGLSDLIAEWPVCRNKARRAGRALLHSAQCPHRGSGPRPSSCSRSSAPRRDRIGLCARGRILRRNRRFGSDKPRKLRKRRRQDVVACPQQAGRSICVDRVDVALWVWCSFQCAQ